MASWAGRVVQSSGRFAVFFPHPEAAEQQPVALFPSKRAAEACLDVCHLWAALRQGSVNLGQLPLFQPLETYEQLLEDLDVEWSIMLPELAKIASEGSDSEGDDEAGGQPPPSAAAHGQQQMPPATISGQQQPPQHGEQRSSSSHHSMESSGGSSSRSRRGSRRSSSNS